MKPKPKKRRKKRTSKKASRATFLLRVGGKIISQESKNGPISIHTNPSFNKSWGIAIILFGLVISSYLFAIVKGEFDWFFFLILSLPLLLFVGLGIGYFRKAKNTVNLSFNLHEQTFYFSEQKGIPFSKISAFTFSETQSTLNSFHPSYQLNILFRNNKEVPLLTTDIRNEILEAAKFLGSKTDINVVEDLL